MANPSLPFTLLLITLCAHFIAIEGATFEIRNQCSFTVWAAASPGGGRRLDPGQSWPIDVPTGTTMARIWGRTNCNFDSGSSGSCETGDCNGLLECQGWGKPPRTLAEYALKDLDFYDISLIEGFNLPMVFTPTAGNGDLCRALTCNADINGQCPTQLQVPGGCQGPCTVFQTDQYCCPGPAAQTCGPTDYSQFFKDRCPDAYSYPKDDASAGKFACPSGTNYRVTFCP
ncbi:LOW QUALITY PROTEIN: thaumatin-like protein 1 [Amborella trichopoda]|uniref:LOW QUALITY PROTEIN: thaumatin-like protein 1 n=1 Tax=Amborella trichopoda TaxID=13333 RepID=UPI0009BEF0A4|nr:LOW QUALITY PROTEIN: thaumatin-like protein 1 [Amborella trichopoda]|eukprot:XP_011626581.2 LOW QUALITY PROTEIN: thaumatin-like protein 1 [Amborella trichopoda]